MDLLDTLDDATAAAAFRRLVRHLRHRDDAQNIDLMGLSGFCRNCLSEWIEEAGELDRDTAKATIYGMPYARWKAEHQAEATPEQIARMNESVAKNARADTNPEGEDTLDEALDESLPVRDTPDR